MNSQGALEKFLYTTNQILLSICSLNVINRQKKLIMDNNTVSIILHKIPETLSFGKKSDWPWKQGIMITRCIYSKGIPGHRVIIQAAFMVLGIHKNIVYT